MRRQRQFPSHLMRDQPANRELVRLVAQLDGLLGGLDAAESAWREWPANVAPGYRSSARNIAHY
jgi:pyruvate kinase